MLRVGVILVVIAGVAGTTPSLAQSLESQGYRFNKAENAWKPIPAYQQPLAEGSAEFIRVLTGQGYYFHRRENTWMPRADYF